MKQGDSGWEYEVGDMIVSTYLGRPCLATIEKIRPMTQKDIDEREKMGIFHFPNELGSPVYSINVEGRKFMIPSDKVLSPKAMALLRQKPLELMPDGTAARTRATKKISLETKRGLNPTKG